MLVIAEAAKASIPLLRKSVKSKPWWTSELKEQRRTLARAYKAVYTTKIAETAEDPESTEFKHTSTLDTVYNLGNPYRDNGEVGKARQMYARAAEGYKQVEGDHDADIRYLREQLSLLDTNDGTCTLDPILGEASHLTVL
jgi:hypothetical protein